MGLTFNSVRMGSNKVSDRWLKAKRALKKEDQIYSDELTRMAKRHSSEAFYAIDDPLEAVVFSVLIEILKEQRSEDEECGSSDSSYHGEIELWSKTDQDLEPLSYTLPGASHSDHRMSPQRSVKNALL